MSIAHNQLRVARELWSRLQPLDRGVPARLQGLLADRRFGSRDRRLYRELLFTALRHARVLAKIAPGDETTWATLLARACAATRETEAFQAAFAATTTAESEVALPDFGPLDLVPDWFAAEVETSPAHPAASEIAAALLTRAPLWVRMQTDAPEDAFAEWAARGWVATPHPALPDAYKLPSETNLSACDTYQAGHYEIQDIGSQLILASLDLPARSPGPRWLDACAGAGGKALQLA
ncbi:MAG: RsmB/NOP family class I SAM-dependent RNA methyltransferase, partial [Burkholderiales bacterium]|nr:RsmB/NOP family class I SAM-dependent RNA methyltransferase [Opitutaceae bacterium]